MILVSDSDSYFGSDFSMADSGAMMAMMLPLPPPLLLPTVMMMMMMMMMIESLSVRLACPVPADSRAVRRWRLACQAELAGRNGAGAWRDSRPGTEHGGGTGSSTSGGSSDCNTPSPSLNQNAGQERATN
jgi:uncharacterized membrane protein YgcG